MRSIDIMRKKIDMTQGSILPLILKFALPLCIGNIFQQLYNTVDTLIVGNFCGPVSLAAVGTSGQPVEILLCVFLGLGTGTSILVSQYTGAGKPKDLKELISTSNTFLFICAVPLTIIGLLLGPFLLKLMQVPDDTFGLATTYLRIVFLGTLGTMGYNMNSGILRGLGDSTSPLLFLIVSCITNIVLDLLFVAGFRMDVAGAALATAIAMFLSWFVSIIYIRKKYPELDFHPFAFRLNKAMLGNLIRVGLPLGLNHSIYSVGHIFLQSLINTQGSTFMAGCAVATKLTGIANIAISSLSSASTTFSGQNYGAQNYVRLRKGIKRVPLCSGLITCAAGLLCTFFCRPLLSLFTKDASVLEVAVLYIQIVLPFTWTYAAFDSMLSFINGMGQVKIPTITNLLMLWAIRIPSAYLIALFISGEHIMICYPISWTTGMLVILFYFRTKHWKNIKALAQDELAATT